MSDRRARREARARSARAAKAQLCRLERRHAVLVEEPHGVLRARAEALGPPRRRTRALRGRVEARRRHGVADLVRRRRPAVVRMDARRLRRPHHRRHRDAGHWHGHSDGDGADRRGGARHPARPRRRRARRQRPRAVRDALGGLVDDAVGRAGGACGGVRREAADHRDRGTAPRGPRGAKSRSRTESSSPRTASLPSRSRSSSGCSRTRRSSARAHAAPTRPG